MNFKEAIKITGAISVILAAFWLFEDRYATSNEVDSKNRNLEYKTVQTLDQFQQKQQQEWNNYRQESEIRWITQRIQDLMNLEREVRMWLRKSPNDPVAKADLINIHNDIVNLRIRLDQLLGR